MKVQLALVETEGVPFALVVVDEDLLDDPVERERNRVFFEDKVFRDLPVVMVSDPGQDEPRFYGRKDLSEFMKGVRMEAIEWTWLDLPHALPSYS